MRIVAAPLALEVTFAIAAARRRLVRAILGAEALHRGPSRNLRALDREVLVRQQAAHLLVVQKFGQELVRNLRVQQPFAVLREIPSAPIPARRPRAQQTSGTAGCNRAAPSAASRSGACRTPAAGAPAAAARVESTAAHCR